MNKPFSPLITLLFSIVVSLLFSSCNNTPNSSDTLMSGNIDTIHVEEQLLFGVDLTKYEVVFDTVKTGWTWNHLFNSFDISQYSINQVVDRLTDNIFGMKYIIAGKPFAIFKPKDALDDTPSMLVYETDPLSYITMLFEEDTIKIEKEYKPVEINEKTISGIIEKNSNLSVELNKNFETYNMTSAVAEAIESIYGWSVDFFRLQVGDKFVVVYDEKSVDGVPYQVDKIKYIWFEHNNKELYAFHYNDTINDIEGYYDEEGNEMKRPFLMAPVKYTRISSSFSPKRFHPVQKRYKAHLGTDYAAPTGTPIFATADGTVSHATRGQHNGIYVKIRHNSVYETQYLHMSRIADGIRPGVRVKQGETIGYVGQTGLATGPHVCYRFWKNGQQINHRSETFPKSEPMKEEAKPAYLEYIIPFKDALDVESQALKAADLNEPEA